MTVNIAGAIKHLENAKVEMFKAGDELAPSPELADELKQIWEELDSAIDVLKSHDPLRREYVEWKRRASVKGGENVEGVTFQMWLDSRENE